MEARQAISLPAKIWRHPSNGEAVKASSVSELVMCIQSKKKRESIDSSFFATYVTITCIPPFWRVMGCISLSKRHANSILKSPASHDSPKESQRVCLKGVIHVRVTYAARKSQMTLFF